VTIAVTVVETGIDARLAHVMGQSCDGATPDDERDGVDASGIHPVVQCSSCSIRGADY
jgi:hypothetical protein